MSFVFTPENLIDNLDKIGGWSLLSLSETAIAYYHPHLKPKDEFERMDIVQMINAEPDWYDVVKRYHLEIGYTTEINPDVVNES